MQPASAMAEVNILGTAALARMAPMGCIVEVGVFRGGSAWHLAEVARERGVALHLFDTFTGIPHEQPDDSNGIGDFADTSLEAVEAAIPDAVFHVGIFPDTLPIVLRSIAFVHCDCDQYRSVRAVIDHLWPRLVAGGIICFDDTDTIGGHRAIEETFQGRLLFAHNRWHVRKGAFDEALPVPLAGIGGGDGPYPVEGDGPCRGIYFEHDAPQEWRQVGATVMVDGVVYTIVGPKMSEAA